MTIHVDTETTNAKSRRTKSTPTPVPAEPTSLYGMARASLAACDGDIEGAIASLMADISKDKSLLRAIVESACHEAMRSYVGAAHRSFRSSCINSTISAAEARGKGEALSRVIERMLLDFPLAGGTPLRDAKRDEVIMNADNYSKLAETNGQRARWLQLIAAETPKGRRVGAAVSEQRARELFAEASQ